MKTNKKNTHTISLVKTEISFPCSTTQTVLNSMAALTRYIWYSFWVSWCGCGVCVVEVLSGKFSGLPMSRKHISGKDEANGRVLACRISPQSDLSLKVVGKLQKSVYKFNVGDKEIF